MTLRRFPEWNTGTRECPLQAQRSLRHIPAGLVVVRELDRGVYLPGQDLRHQRVVEGGLGGQHVPGSNTHKQSVMIYAVLGVRWSWSLSQLRGVERDATVACLGGPAGKNTLHDMNLVLRQPTQTQNLLWPQAICSETIKLRNQSTSRITSILQKHPCSIENCGSAGVLTFARFAAPPPSSRPPAVLLWRGDRSKSEFACMPTIALISARW